MTDNTQKITHLLSAQIPDYVQEFYPLFVVFVTKYFEYLQNSSTGVQTTLQNLQLNRDIDTTSADLAREFLHTYLPELPDDSAANKEVLVKYFRQFYQLKGSPESFRLFFKAFFDDNIEVQYPRNYLFKTSDGEWYNETSLRVQSLAGDPLNLKHTYVTGNTSSAYATINDVIAINALGAINLYDLILQPETANGTFTTGETVTGRYYDFENNLSSLVTVTTQSGTTTAPGRYLNSNSQLSNDQLLQDSLYYQQFSYVLKTHTDRINWYDTVLNELHPAGLALFNNYIDDSIADFASGNTTSIAIQSQVTSSIRIPAEKSYLTSPTFTFDRTGDEQTGTSTTRLATTTGFATITYTSIGAIVRDSDYDYPGLNVTWALQKINDGVTITELIADNGPSFDKLSRAVGLDDELTALPRDVNTSIATTRTTRVSSALTAGTLLTSFSSQTLRYSTSITNATSVGSMILLLTWTKNSTGNNAKGESSNAVVISFSSAATVIPYFGAETQRNLKYLALNDSLGYNKLTYFNSSNSIQSSITPDIPFTSTALTGQAGSIVFKPYNWERGLSYDRASLRFEIAAPQQLNTSLTETFLQVTSTVGLIASYSSVSTSISAVAFVNQSSNLLLYSEQFDNAGWNKSPGVTVTSNVTTGPTGTATADLIAGLFNGGAGGQVSTESPALDPGYYTYSCYYKSSGSSLSIFHQANLDYSGGSIMAIDVNLTSGTVSVRFGSPINYGIQNVGSGWYRVWMTGLRVSSVLPGAQPYLGSAVTTSDSVLMWGAQLERKTMVQTYVSSTAAIISPNVQNTDFSSACFVFNNSSSVSSLIQTIAFTTAALVTATVTYIVGDNFNGGTLPVTGQNLVLQFSTSAGSTWTTAAVLWSASSSINWSYGTTSLAGQIITQAGTNFITGVGTTFATDLIPGDRITLINSSVTTAYTITSIINNNLLQVSPNTVTFNAGFTALTGLGIIVTSAGSDTMVSASPDFANLQIGSTLALTSSNGTTTYTVTQLINSYIVTVSPVPVYTTGVTGYLATGIPGFHKLPASRSFYTTSISVINQSSNNTSIIIRAIQLASSSNVANYAIDSLRIDSYRLQATTGIVNISVAVSSNSTLNINDTDFFTITTIGT